MAEDRRIRPGALTWTRFDKYVVDGGVVRPASGSHSEQFDPWDSYEPLTKSAAAPPYQTLLTLHSELRWRHGARDEVELDEPSVELLLGWCRRYGLPGILLEDLESVEFPARWEPQAHARAKQELVPTVLGYHRRGADWHEVRRQSPPGLRHIVERSPKRARGELVAANLDGWNTPGVHLRDADTGRVGIVAVDDPQLGRFFPVGHGFADGPFEPASPAFWKSYGEPLALLERRVHSIAHALEALHAGDPGPLNQLASHNCQTIVTTNGHAMPCWTSRSLIGAMVAMAMQDVVSGGEVLICAGCRAAFVSGAYQARYCSSRCRNRVTQRRHRERVRRTESPREDADE